VVLTIRKRQGENLTKSSMFMVCSSVRV
jgi:hypothetical protein